MKCLIYILFVLISPIVKSSWTLEKVSGAVRCKEHSLYLGKPLPEKCELKVSKSSGAVLKSDKGQEVYLGALFEGEVGDNQIMIKEGSLRVKTPESSFKIKNPLGELVVESGEAVALTSKMFTEFQVLNLSGKMQIHSEKEKVPLYEGSWAGIGGRFGVEIGDLFNLNDEQRSFLMRDFLLDSPQ